jgi:ubiquinone biosynthesis protein
MKLTSIPQFARNLNRATEVVTILSKYGLADWIARLDMNLVKGIYRRTLGRSLTDMTTERRIRLAMIELGTTFIKLGQVLSTRPDIVGLPLATELSNLQANVPADPPEVVHETIKAELGRPVDELFAYFDDKALASASIGQVHAARLKDGTSVVVKVQHPRITERIRNDLEILTGLAEQAEKYLEEIRPYQPKAIVREFERTLTRELDFMRELRNLERFNKNFAGDPTVRIPKPYPELSTNRVLTMDRLEGLSIAEMAREGGDPGAAEFARRGARVFMEMIFRHGFYHADPHPANILILSGGVIGLIDVGMVGQLTPTLKEDLEDLLLALGTSNPDQMVAVLTRLCQPSTIPDPGVFAADVTDFLGYYQGVPLDRIDISAALNEITEIIRQHHLLLPTGIALLIRVLVVLEGTSRLLHPDFKLSEVIEPFQKRMVAERFSPIRQGRKLRAAVRDWQMLISRLPSQMRDMIQKAQTGRIEVQLEHHHLQPSINRMVLGLITAAMILGSSILWAAKAPPTLFDISIVGVFGTFFSSIMGIRLVRAILRTHSFEGK